MLDIQGTLSISRHDYIFEGATRNIAATLYTTQFPIVSELFCFTVVCRVDNNFNGRTRKKKIYKVFANEKLVNAN